MSGKEDAAVEGSIRSRRGLRTYGVMLATLAAVALTVALPSPAGAASHTHSVRGTVICKSSSKRVVAVAAEVQGGGTKGASFNVMPYGKTNAAYYAVAVTNGQVNAKIRIRVGCGGTAGRPDSQHISGYATVGRRRTLNTLCDRGSCAWPGRGGVGSGAAAGCVKYVYNRWEEATGRYPYWPGRSAKDANNNSNGWRVSSVPHVRSAVVFEPGVHGADRTHGHMAWVTDVSIRSGRAYVTIKESVTGNPNRTRTVEHRSSGMSYIVATV